MNKLQEFQVAARARGFVDVEESEQGSVLWLRKQTPDAATQTHKRICIDSGTSTMTVYWMNDLGKVDSKTFRNVPSMQQWFALQPAE